MVAAEARGFLFLGREGRTSTDFPLSCGISSARRLCTELMRVPAAAARPAANQLDQVAGTGRGTTRRYRGTPERSQASAEASVIREEASQPPNPGPIRFAYAGALTGTARPVDRGVAHKMPPTAARALMYRANAAYDRGGILWLPTPWPALSPPDSDSPAMRVGRRRSRVPGSHIIRGLRHRFPKPAPSPTVRFSAYR